jgi:hypothetical protein
MGESVKLGFGLAFGALLLVFAYGWWNGNTGPVAPITVTTRKSLLNDSPVFQLRAQQRVGPVTCTVTTAQGGSRGSYYIPQILPGQTVEVGWLELLADPVSTDRISVHASGYVLPATYTAK